MSRNIIIDLNYLKVTLVRQIRKTENKLVSAKTVNLRKLSRNFWVSDKSSERKTLNLTMHNDQQYLGHKRSPKPHFSPSFILRVRGDWKSSVQVVSGSEWTEKVPCDSLRAVKEWDMPSNPVQSNHFSHDKRLVHLCICPPSQCSFG